MTDKPQPKPYILDIAPYVPGVAKAADGRALIKLSANENPLGCSDAASEAMTRRHETARYPDPDSIALRTALGELHAIEPARIVCGTGSDELLNLAAQAFAGHDAQGRDEVLMPQYSFSVYPIAARRVGAVPVEAPARDFGADVDALLAAVTERTRIVFIANPNNPTGTYLPHDEIARLRAGLPRDVLFVLDQAYAEYLPDGGAPGLALAGEAENVLVTRTFSKIYGLASARVGWATGAPHLVDALNRIRGPFNVTGAAQAGALAALGDQDFVKRSREENARLRKVFVARLDALGNRGIATVPSEANFVLVRFPDQPTAERVRDAIADAGYAVRHLPGQGLGEALRITIGREEDMARVGDAIEAGL
ncbi:histidinol-phosphate transaminase [Alteriqipengyuania lutimaris]|uniref:Histidinol-phosphate aminotransferase n=1 Tax=Alteriqipengyuania lutimaris TaxID=1538146 RepID=A0A395LNW5_9SPHN|nr:histidinol-phosphate transaminase [Alteriqipengyuania lutimaris]MBB3033812.1 histidinol-phosphate aminotransferase [Alteriqipengyuania lutimaris]RDS77214.1 histidinol-phosphate transaminase [Alteriqipengyuania lutimaris]